MLKDLLIKWKQDYEFLQSTDIGSKREKLASPIWHTFNNNDLTGKSRTFGINLFSNGTPVVIKQKDEYVVNNRDLLDKYQLAGKTVRLLSDCQLSGKAISEVGFI